MKLLFVVIILAFTQISGAAKVDKIKNDKILITLKDDEKVIVGDNVYALQEAAENSTAEDESNATITQVRGNQAVAKMNTGAFTEGQFIVIQKTTKAKKKATTENVVYRFDLLKVSVLGKLIANSVSTKQADNTLPYPNEETVDMSGLNFGIMGVAEYPMPWYKKITARGSFGYEPVNVNGTGTYLVCDGRKSKDCNINISYLSLGAHARYDFFKSKSIFWGSLGGTLKLPFTKKSSALQEADIRIANSIVMSLGVDFIQSNKIFYPFSFEYHYSLNKSATVPVINEIAFQGGYGWQF